ncbi:MAG TPA: GDSL-type esterase/lipase family protein [Thermoanaerobaculia bacterium]
MRRFLLWGLPLTVALASTVIFGFGFVSFLRGDTGRPVDFVPQQRASAATATPSRVVAPIVLGDSLARGAGDEAGLGIPGRLDNELRRRNIKANRTISLGINGARTPDLQRQIESANVRGLLRDANVIVVSIGGNDLWGGANWREAPPTDPDAAMTQVLDRIAAIVGEIREVNPTARIFFIGLYNPFVKTPNGAMLSTYVAQWNARVLERFGRDGNFTLVQTSDLFSHKDRLALDRFHPGGEGYELIARRIADGL